MSSATAGSSNLGDGNSSIGLLGVTADALQLQYVTGGETPSDAELDAEMAQVAANLREDHQFDEQGWSGSILRHGTMFMVSLILGALVYLSLAVFFTKTTTATSGETEKKRESIKDLDRKGSAALPRA